MIRHLALAILLALIAATPTAAAQTRIGGGGATGPAIWHSITSKPTTGTASTGPSHIVLPFQPGTYPKEGAIQFNLQCVYCTGHDGGVGQQPN